MKILLFGVSNVGKTTVGKKLAAALNYPAYDLDEEVTKYYNTTIEEFVHTDELEIRDEKRRIIIGEILKKSDNMVFSITPLSHKESFIHYLDQSDVFPIYMYDSPRSIFDRLVFSDENDVVYTDDEYKYEHEEHYMEEIGADLDWYGYIYSSIRNKFDMKGDDPDEVVKRMIKKYKLKPLDI